MTVVRSEVRPGVYHDSIVLMQLQVSLMDLPGVLDAGAVMGSPENLQILEANELLPETLSGVRAGDLVVAVKAESEDDAARALRSVEALLVRGGSEVNEDFRPGGCWSPCQGDMPREWRERPSSSDATSSSTATTSP